VAFLPSSKPWAANTTATMRENEGEREGRGGEGRGGITWGGTDGSVQATSSSLLFQDFLESFPLFLFSRYLFSLSLTANIL
jgi:hypothetical protein